MNIADRIKALIAKHHCCGFCALRDNNNGTYVIASGQLDAGTVFALIARLIVDITKAADVDIDEFSEEVNRIAKLMLAEDKKHGQPQD